MYHNGFNFMFCDWDKHVYYIHASRQLCKMYLQVGKVICYLNTTTPSFTVIRGTHAKTCILIYTFSTLNVSSTSEN